MGIDFICKQCGGAFRVGRAIQCCPCCGGELTENPAEVRARDFGLGIVLVVLILLLGWLGC